MFPVTAYELLLKSYGRYFDSLLVKTNYVVYSLVEFVHSNISDLLKYLITSSLSMALPEVIKICLINHYNVQCIYPAVILWCEEGHVCNMQTQERLTVLPLMLSEKKILQDLDNNLNFCDSVTDIFSEKTCHKERKYKV
jgi:hypothetical protein